MSRWYALAYRLGVIAIGLGWLLWSLLQPHDPISWGLVGLFVAVSWLVKRAGFRVVEEVTHSLVNVVDVGALLVLGPLDGALVAAISSIFHVQFSILRRPDWEWRQLFDLPLFDGGVKALLALGGGTFYLLLGGTIAPTAVSVSLLLPLANLFLFWFTLDHLLWTGLFALSGGIERARTFLRRIFLASLVIELAPLPFALLFAVAWTLFDPVLRALSLIALTLVAAVVRGFALALHRAEERMETVSLLNKFGQALVLAQLDEAKLAALLYDYASQLIPEARFDLFLLDEECRYCTPISLSSSVPGRAVELMPRILPLVQGRPHGRLLPDLSPASIEAEAHRGRGERPERGSVLVIPLLARDELLGVLLAESNIPDALTIEDGRSLSVLAAEAAVALQNAHHFRQEQWRVRQLQIIAEVSRMVASIINLDELLWQVVERIRSAFGYFHVQIYLAEPETRSLVYRAGSGPAGRTLAETPPKLKIGTEGIIGWVGGSGEPLLVNDVSKDARYVLNNSRVLADTQAELAVPLKVEDRVLGVLDVQSDRAYDFDEDDTFTLTTLADQVAVAIEDARLYMAQREEAWVTSALLQVAEALNSVLDLDAVLQTVVRTTPALIGVDAMGLYLWQGEERGFEWGAFYGLGCDNGQELRGCAPTDKLLSLLAEVRAQGRIATLEDMDCSILAPVWPSCDTVSLIGVPMQAQREFVGVLLVVCAGSLYSFSTRRRALLSGIAQQAAVAIQASRFQMAQQEETAITRDLLQVAELIASQSDPQAVLELITRLAVTMTEVTRCAVYLWDEERQCLVPAEGYGFLPEIEAAWRESELSPDEVDFQGLLTGQTEPIIVDPLATGRSTVLQALFDSSTLAAMPLRARDMFLGVMLVDLGDHVSREGRWRPVLTGIARQLSSALENAKLYEEALENERRSQELVLARQIQSALLPDKSPQLPGYDIAGYWRPAREVAGDFYDFLTLSHNRFAFSIADVADKGIGAALFMVLARTALRESVWGEEDAGRAMERANALIAADVSGGMFLTAFLAILSPESGHLQAANAGHLPPIIYRAVEDSLVSAVQRNVPLGIIGDTRYDTIESVLALGDTVVLVTDGVVDVMNSRMELFGLQRLAEVVYAHRAADARGMVNAILDAVTLYASGEPFMDDLTIVVVRRLEGVEGLEG